MENGLHSCLARYEPGVFLEIALATHPGGGRPLGGAGRLRGVAPALLGRVQDPAALRDAAATSVQAALSCDPSQQAAATNKAAEALAKAQNIPVDQARSQIEQYQQQYKDMVAKTKEQAKEATDSAAKAVSRGALFGAMALLLGALAAFFAGQAGAVVPTVRGSGQNY